MKLIKDVKIVHTVIPYYNIVIKTKQKQKFIGLTLTYFLEIRQPPITAS